MNFSIPYGPIAPEETMSETTRPAIYMQALRDGHVLAMECGNLTIRFLDRAQAAGPGRRDLRSDLEAMRMGALVSRLMENVRRAITLTHAGRAPTLLPPPSKSTEAIPDREGGKLHAAPGAPRGRLK